MTFVFLVEVDLFPAFLETLLGAIMIMLSKLKKEEEGAPPASTATSRQGDLHFEIRSERGIQGEAQSRSSGSYYVFVCGGGSHRIIFIILTTLYLPIVFCGLSVKFF